MARPRSISDERLLTATGAVISRAGSGFTLAQVAEEAGVAVGSVAQRFGSKKGLLQALSKAGREQAITRVRDAAGAAAGPREALRDALVTVYAGLGDAAEAANSLGQLAADLADSDLRSLLGEHYAALESELRSLVILAVDTGWRGPSPEIAARTLLATVNGAALDWSIRPRGALSDRLAEDVDSIVGSWYA
ncbi:TetR/AcrR family transcriptional regulator [Prauserella cavernicola]|uniref:TetR/AcrR family transcriptional regulator n=1 Tax=Prauserella cavernicola TaxID=2800127 RepID=A0A934V5I6_9PSEU|nr:TetR/AcrR family transcriptional regulator [Prauserella cavernicola]MBK1784648.1 TetR/AcrR family transcriptional regulator [Prauserella cavernicola]